MKKWEIEAELKELCDEVIVINQRLESLKNGVKKLWEKK